MCPATLPAAGSHLPAPAVFSLVTEKSPSYFIYLLIRF